MNKKTRVLKKKNIFIYRQAWVGEKERKWNQSLK